MENNNEIVFNKVANDFTETYDISIKKGNQELQITFGGNLDAYWNLMSRCGGKFIIDKENNELYKSFKRLYDDIKNCQIFKITEEEKENGSWNKTPKERQKELDELNDWEKRAGEYKYLYNQDTGVVEWFSDEESMNIANSVRISDLGESIELEFVKRSDSIYTPIRFRNSGSRYGMFNVIIMRHFNELSDMDDKSHQMDLEEVAYRMRVKL